MEQGRAGKVRLKERCMVSRRARSTVISWMVVMDRQRRTSAIKRVMARRAPRRVARAPWGVPL